MRKTRQRQAIRAAFEAAGRPLSIAEALDEAQRKVPGMGPATVYRAVNALVEDGYLKAVELPSEPARYELAELGHHHHFHCRSCSRVFDVPGCPGKLGQLAPPGFEVASHEIILYGRCTECVAADEAS